jgi:hypothetical protein
MQILAAKLEEMGKREREGSGRDLGIAKLL